MPLYEYQCDECGPFSAMRAVKDYQEPCPCDGCGALAPRTLLSNPAFAGMDGALRQAHGRNERSAHAPVRASHPSSCGCCRKTGVRTAENVTPKSFPASRPWMISH